MTPEQEAAIRERAENNPGLSADSFLLPYVEALDAWDGRGDPPGYEAYGQDVQLWRWYHHGARDRAALLEEVDRLRETLRFTASVYFQNLAPQPTGAALLEAVAFYMDRRDDERGIPPDRGSEERQVQADLRRWAAAIRAVLP